MDKNPLQDVATCGNVCSTMKVNPAALRTIRERSGVSVTSLATSVGIKQSHLSNIEAGRRNASDDVIVGLARELKCELPAIICAPEAVSA